jgi:pectate lyase
MGSTAITISNNHFAHHDEVMLLGHNDKYSPDKGMQVTIAFNHFGQGLIQRMPRCRLGYIHVVNNDFTQWEMYAIGGSANPTINSQGNRYTAPSDPNAKEVRWFHLVVVVILLFYPFWLVAFFNLTLLVLFFI